MACDLMQSASYRLRYRNFKYLYWHLCFPRPNMNRNISPTSENAYLKFLGQDAVCLGVKLDLAA